jgi:subtilisin family serine protease
MSAVAPWRRPARDHFPGVPAWGAPSAVVRTDAFAACTLPLVTREWAWGGADGSGIRVCVLDSGVDGAHPQIGTLEQSMTVMASADGGLAIGEADPVDLAGHGTACASIIRAMAPGAALAAMRVLTDGRYGSGAALLAGLEWAIDEGYDVINMSLSTTKAQFSQALHELADRAYFRRCILVSSAHNMPVRSFPWLFPSVVSVASHDERDAMTYYYNPAPPVEFYARGLRVPTAWPGGGTAVNTGNSFATPHIAAICALILSKHPDLTPFQLKSVLYQVASNVTGHDGGTGTGE